jgi:hypothetical protein
MKKVSSKHHLSRRNGVYNYRRRVPTHLVEALGKKMIQFSLGTSNLSEAKKACSGRPKMDHPVRDRRKIAEQQRYAS